MPSPQHSHQPSPGGLGGFPEHRGTRGWGLTFLQAKSAGSLQGQTVTRELELNSGLTGLMGPPRLALPLPSLSLGREHQCYPSCPGRGTPKGERGT